MGRNTYSKTKRRRDATPCRLPLSVVGSVCLVGKKRCFDRTIVFKCVNETLANRAKVKL